MIVHTCAQGTPEWQALRLGKPTASEAAKLVYGDGKLAKASTMKAYAEKLAGDLYAGEDTTGWAGSAATEYGHDNESKARDYHAYKISKNISEVGFVTDDLIRYGASPDGLVGEPEKWIGGGEYKCKPVKHLSALLYYRKNGTVENEYIPQCHQNIMLCDLEWMDLCYWHKKLPKLIVRINRDESFIKSLKNQLSLCVEHRDETLNDLKKMGDLS